MVQKERLGRAVAAIVKGCYLPQLSACGNLKRDDINAILVAEKIFSIERHLLYICWKWRSGNAT